MEELGIKPPSKLWLFFEKYTISMSFAIASLIIIATGFAFRYADLYLDRLAHEELVAAEPGSNIKQIGPVISAAVQLQKNGNQQVVTELADATEVLRGQQNTRKAIVEAAQQMMKGADTAFYRQCIKDGAAQTVSITRLWRG